MKAVEASRRPKHTSAQDQPRLPTLGLSMIQRLTALTCQYPNKQEVEVALPVRFDILVPLARPGYS